VALEISHFSHSCNVFCCNRPSAYPEILRLFPNAAIEHIDGAGHWVHSEKPYEFLDMVLQFLKSVDS